jgi:membrane protease subunit (stomatin/prohibitin family)
MGIIRAFTGAISGTFADQWKDIITAGNFTEQTAVSPGILRQSNRGRGSNFYGSNGVITNGSKIFVPENTAAFIFSQSGIEDIITESGGYEYQHGQESIFNGDGATKSIFNQVADRVGYGGQTSDEKRIAFVNLREIRDIKFGTRGPLLYHDAFYGADLAVLAFGRFSLKVIDPTRFIRNYVPANISYYSFDDPNAKSQILSEFIQSFTVAINSLSSSYRISELPAKSIEIEAAMLADSTNAGTWNKRFGFEIVEVGIENIDFSPESKELVSQYSSTVVEAAALARKREVEGFTYQQQRGFDVAEKVAQNEGVGEFSNMGIGLGMVSGVGGTVGNTVGNVVGGAMSQAINPAGVQASQDPVPASDALVSAQRPTMSIGEQIEAVKKLKELMDAGILSQEEFNAKKKEIMGL